MTARSIATSVFAAALLGAVAGGPAAADDERFCSAKSLTVRTGEVREGDTYFFGGNLDVSGTIDGDLIGMSQVAVVSGVIDGDVAMGGSSLDISGDIRDSVRYLGNALNVSGTVDGDVLGFGNTFNLHPRGHITGGLYVLGSSLLLDGVVDGSVRFTGGRVMISGTIGGNATLEADEIVLDPSARILGNLTYTARKPLETDPSSVVVGEVHFEEREPENEDSGTTLTTGDVLYWCWKALGAILVGLVALAAAGRGASAVSGSIDREPMLGALIGFGAFLVTPAAALLAIVLVVTLPLGVLALLLFLVALYLAKLPVALWLGSRLLRPLGGGRASPYLALVVGVVLLQLLYEVPYVGWIVWLASVWLGLGAGILAVRGRGDSSGPSPAEAAAAVAIVSGGPADGD